MMDLVKPGDSFVAAQGGKGGKGNVNFKNSVRQAPNFAQAGGAAKERNIVLELKMIADVGLVGFPNVGKSTILSVSTNSKPKIANYHFTTISPNLGVVSIGNDGFVMADIAGIIEGAHAGAGLGHEFLKHIERTKVLIHVVDVSGSEGRNPIEDFDKINAELELYDANLAKKPQIVAANKIDMISEDDETYIAFKEYIESKGIKVFPVCAPILQGIQPLLNEASNVLNSLEDEEVDLGYEYFDFEKDDEEPDFKEVYVAREPNGVFSVTGKQLRKIFDSTNFNDTGSLRYLYKYIEDKGAVEQMKEMGLEEGDIVKVFDYEFEYWEEY